MCQDCNDPIQVPVLTASVINGKDGQSVYGYYASADNLSGAGFNFPADSSQEYRALLITPTSIPNPQVGAFSGLWYKAIGSDGTNGTNGTNGLNGVFGGVTFEYNFIGYGVTGAPGNGNLSFSSATASNTTSIYLSDFDVNSIDLDSLYQFLGVPNNLNKAFVKVTAKNDSSKYAVFTVVNLGAAAVGWKNIIVNYLGGSTTSFGSERVLFTFVNNGSEGPPGPQGSAGPTGPTGATGPQGPSFVNYANVIYVDDTNGDDSTGLKNRLDRPFKTYAAATTVALSGDIIYIRRGLYTADIDYVLKDLVDVYCEPGTIIYGGFTDDSILARSKVYGYANFLGTVNRPALWVKGTNSEIFFEFDRIEGNRPTGIAVSSNSVVTCIGNKIICGTPYRDENRTKKVTIKIRELISATGTYGIRVGSNSVVPAVGFLYIECPIIENTSSAAYRCAVYFDGRLSEEILAGQNNTITINAGKIRMTNLTMTETRPEIISSAVWWDGGNNITINADLEGNNCLAVCNRGGSSFQITGSMVINGNVSSNIECISSNTKVNTGQGYGNIIFKNGLIKTKGLGASGSAVESGNAWNTVHAGVPGNIQFINCVLYNETPNGNIVQHDIPNTGTNKNIYFYNCVAATEGAAGNFAATVQANKIIGMHNVRSNKNIPGTITDAFTPTGFIFDNTLVIPKL